MKMITLGLPLALGLTILSTTSVAGTWASGPDMAQQRYYHTATRLRSGEVVVIGGSGESTRALDSAEIYDPARSNFSPAAGRMGRSRVWHSATRLRNGQVLVVGGMNAEYASHDTAELFDPATRSFRLVRGRLSVARYKHTATLLPGGKVLIAGGGSGTGVAEPPATVLDSAEIYDPASETFTPVSSRMASPRYVHTATSLRIRSGLYRGAVLLIGGDDGAAGPFSGLTACELFVPRLGRFEYGGDLLVGRLRHTATRIRSRSSSGSSSGRTRRSGQDPQAGSVKSTLQVLVAGGTIESRRAEIYDFRTRTFSFTDETSSLHFSSASATFLPGKSGRVLLVGGTNGDYYSCTDACPRVLDTSQEYVVGAREWRRRNALHTARAYHTATRLLSGKVLIVGGYSSGGDLSSLRSSELYTP